MNKELIVDLENKIKKIIKDNYNVEVDNIDFEIPANIENGHLSTNVALKNSKVLKTAPINVGEIIKNNLTSDENIEKIEVVKPGFINIFYSKKYIKDILLNRINLDFFIFEDNNKNINVEYVSANPTGDLHLGHARNAVFGDALGSLLSRVGNNVTKEYYINDAGVQMQNLGKSIKAFYLENCGQDLEFPEEGYKGKEIKDTANKLFEEYSDSKMNEELEFFIEYGYNRNMDEIKNILGRLNVSFDLYSSERYYHDNGLVKEALETLEDKNEVYTLEGAKWLATSKYGDDKDRVLEKSDGTHTYLTSDIAYHKDKMQRTNGLLINIWGADHHGYVNRVEAAMQSLGFEKDRLETVLIQMVSVLENNEKVKMSKRAGTSVTIKDLLDIIEEDTLRYFFIMRSPDTQLDFDIALAKKENSENPIFYIQYAHARICSLESNATIKIDNQSTINEGKLTDLDTELILNLNKYGEVLLEAAKSRRPHILANYLYDIASNYHRFYNQEKILVDDNEFVTNKLLISNLTKKVISDGLNILGINAKEKM